MFSKNQALAAYQFLDRKIVRTPLMPLMNQDIRAFFKLENLQLTGSFKIRGAYYKLSQLSDFEKQQGVIAASAGNHAQGVAYAAKQLHIEATIFMPENAPQVKVAATKALGANVIQTGKDFDCCYEAAQAYQQQHQITFIEPFNDLDVIIGQSTIAIEILEDYPDVDVILVPIGGGGLAAGISTYLSKVKPTCQVIGVESISAASMQESILHNKPTMVNVFPSIADGLAVKQPGDLTYNLCKQHLQHILKVSESEIKAAIKILYNRYHLVVEGAGAVTMAAFLKNYSDFIGKNVVILVSGSNIDSSVLFDLLRQ